jgi:hypothetical protein
VCDDPRVSVLTVYHLKDVISAPSAGSNGIVRHNQPSLKIRVKAMLGQAVVDTHEVGKGDVAIDWRDKGLKRQQRFRRLTLELILDSHIPNLGSLF